MNVNELSIIELKSHFCKLLAHAEEIIRLPEVREDDGRKIAIWLLFNCISREAKAISILLISNLPDVTEVLVRATIEALFHLGGVVNDEEYARKYWGLQSFIDKRNLNAVLKNPNLDLHYSNDEIAELNSLLEQRKRFIEEENLGKGEMKAEDWASKANLKSLYTAYRIYSDAVHSNPRYLHDCYLISKGDSIQQINFDSIPLEKNRGVILTMNLVLALSCSRFRMAFEIAENPVAEIEKYYIEERLDM